MANTDNEVYAFTDVELAILAQAAYCKNAREGMSLYKFLTANDDYMRKALGDNYEVAYNQLLDKVKDSDYTIVKAVDDKDGTGFAAFAVRTPDNEVAVACRGTEGFSMDYDSRKDVLTDGMLATNLVTDQQAQMSAFMADLQDNYNFSGYYFSGHSLGGNLAIFGTIILRDPSLLKKTITINAPGYNDMFWRAFKDKIDKVKNNITNFQNEFDGVSSCFTVPGNNIICESDGLDLVGVNAHMLDMLKIDDKNGTFVANKSQKKAPSVLNAVLAIVTVSIDGFYKLLPGLVTVDLFIWTIKSVGKLIKESTRGYRYANNNPYINIDTTSLSDYATRLRNVNQRLINVDGRLDGLYRKVDIWDIGSLAMADIHVGSSYRITQSASYLESTANAFNQAEASISAMF